MASHYITTSKKAITEVASKLAGVGDQQKKFGEQWKVEEERKDNSKSGRIISVRKKEEDLFGDDCDDQEMYQIADMAEKKASITSGFPAATKVFIIQGGTNTFH